MHTETTARPIRPRDPGLTFDAAEIPRYWFAESPLATHLSNGVNLLFPAGERFFIRAVRHYLDQVKDPALREQVRGFFGQEGRHAGTHERFFAVLEAQGYAVGPFLRVYEALAYDGLEAVSPPALRLAATAALEHFTAIMAEDALRRRFLDMAHPALRDLLLWHAAEEIEHKSVAFDVLQQINPSYALRVAGMALAATCLGGFWAAATAMFLAQDRLAGRRKVEPAEVAAIRAQEPLGKRVFLRGIREYLRRDFHPNDNDNRALAAQYLASAGLA